MREPAERWQCEFGPARLVFGTGAISATGDCAREVGMARVLLVTDPGVRRAGHADTAMESLERAGIAVVVHDRVRESPTTRDVEEAAAVVRNEQPHGLVALGGGSAMDVAKGANLLATNGGRMEDYRGRGRAPRPLLPMIALPTTAGTGSEAQSFALIAREDDGTKMACGDKQAMFRAVILDPVLAATAPREVKAAAGIDAISHAVESYVTRERNPVSQLYGREAWRLLAGAFTAALADSADLDAHGRMLLGSFLAGAAIEQSMLGAAHACANPLTARYPIPHGVAVGLMLPHVVRFNCGVVGTLYEELQAAVGDGGSLADRIRDLRRSGGLPETLRECSVARERLAEMAEDASRQWTAGHNPRAVAAADLRELYETAY